MPSYDKDILAALKLSLNNENFGNNLPSDVSANFVKFVMNDNDDGIVAVSEFSQALNADQQSAIANQSHVQSCDANSVVWAFEVNEEQLSQVVASSLTLGSSADSGENNVIEFDSADNVWKMALQEIATTKVSVDGDLYALFSESLPALTKSADVGNKSLMQNSWSEVPSTKTSSLTNAGYYHYEKSIANNTADSTTRDFVYNHENQTVSFKNKNNDTLVFVVQSKEGLTNNTTLTIHEHVSGDNSVPGVVPSSVSMPNANQFSLVDKEGGIHANGILLGDAAVDTIINYTDSVNNVLENIAYNNGEVFVKNVDGKVQMRPSADANMTSYNESGYQFNQFSFALHPGGYTFTQMWSGDGSPNDSDVEGAWVNIAQQSSLSGTVFFSHPNLDVGELDNKSGSNKGYLAIMSNSKLDKTTTLGNHDKVALQLVAGSVRLSPKDTGNSYAFDGSTLNKDSEQLQVQVDIRINDQDKLIEPNNVKQVAIGWAVSGIFSEQSNYISFNGEEVVKSSYPGEYSSPFVVHYGNLSVTCTNKDVSSVNFASLDIDDNAYTVVEGVANQTYAINDEIQAVLKHNNTDLMNLTFRNVMEASSTNKVLRNVNEVFAKLSEDWDELVKAAGASAPLAQPDAIIAERDYTTFLPLITFALNDLLSSVEDKADNELSTKVDILNGVISTYNEAVSVHVSAVDTIKENVSTREGSVSESLNKLNGTDGITATAVSDAFLAADNELDSLASTCNGYDYTTLLNTKHSTTREALELDATSRINDANNPGGTIPEYRETMVGRINGVKEAAARAKGNVSTAIGNAATALNALEAERSDLDNLLEKIQVQLNVAISSSSSKSAVDEDEGPTM